MAVILSKVYLIPFKGQNDDRQSPTYARSALPESWIFLTNISLTAVIKLVNVDKRRSVSRVLSVRNTSFNQSHDFIYDFSSAPAKKCWEQKSRREKVSLSERTLRAGFEPARGDPIGFQVQRLNHSAITAKSGNIMCGIVPRKYKGKKLSTVCILVTRNRVWPSGKANPKE